MSRNTRMLLLIVLVVIIGAAAALLLMGGGTDTPASTEVAQNDDATPRPQENAEPTEPPVPTQELTTVIIAVQDIARGQEIPASALALAPWPVDALPINAIDPNQFTIEDLAGAIARTDIYIDQPMLLSYIAPSRAELAASGSDVSTIIPEGKVALSVPIDRLTSVAYAIQPGDRVDISVALLFVDIDEEFQSLLPNEVNLLSYDGINWSTLSDLAGRFETQRVPITIGDLLREVQVPIVVSPSEDPRPRLVVQRTVIDANVLYVGNFPVDGRIFLPEPTPTPAGIDVDVDTGTASGGTTGDTGADFTVQLRPDIVTLAVTPQEALVLSWLIEARVPLNFFLRSAADNSRVPTDAVTLEYIMNTYGVTLPPPRDFSIEPAVRSIRQLLTEDVVPLQPSGATVEQANNSGTGDGTAENNTTESGQ